MIWNFDLTRSPCAVESRMSSMTFAGRCIDYGAGVLCVYMFILIWYFADSTLRSWKLRAYGVRLCSVPLVPANQ